MYFLHVTPYTLPQTKCNGYIVTVTKGLSGIVTSYLGTNVQNLVVTPLLLLSNMVVTH